MEREIEDTIVVGFPFLSQPKERGVAARLKVTFKFWRVEVCAFVM
jgi:hypothetical protein